MASHSEIKVGSTEWVIRIGGKDVQVKVLEKIKKASGRGWEFRCKRFENGRSVGRDLIRGSGSLRRAGEPVRATGFSKNAPTAAAATPPPPPKRRARQATRTRQAPQPPPPLSYARNPPASAFFPGVQEPGAPRSSAPAPSPAAGGRLGSLRGRGRSTVPRSTAPARAATTPSSPTQAKREIERQLKHAGLTPLTAYMIQRLLACDGSDFAMSQVYGDVMSEYRLNMGPFRQVLRR